RSSLRQACPERSNQRQLQPADRRVLTQGDGLQTRMGTAAEREEVDRPSCLPQTVHQQATEDLGATAGVGRHQNVDSGWGIMEIAQGTLEQASVFPQSATTSRPSERDMGVTPPASAQPPLHLSRRVSPAGFPFGV